MANSNRVLTRALNLEGTGWDPGDREPSMSLITTTGIPKVFAVFELSGFKVLLYRQNQYLKVTRFRRVGNQGDTRTLDVEAEQTGTLVSVLVGSKM